MHDGAHQDGIMQKIHGLVIILVKKPFEISLHTMNLNIAKTSHSSTWCRAHSGGGDASPHRQQRNLWGFQLKEDHPRAFRVVFFYHS